MPFRFMDPHMPTVVGALIASIYADCQHAASTLAAAVWHVVTSAWRTAISNRLICQCKLNEREVDE